MPRIKDPTLLAEIGRRRLTRTLCETYLSQRDGAFAFANDAGGFVTYRRQEYQDHHGKIGPTAITTIEADPMQDAISIFVFTHFWDFLTWCHLQGLPTPTQTHIITNGLTEEAAAALQAETRADRLFLVADGIEHDFIDALDRDDLPVLVKEPLSAGFMADPQRLRRSMAGTTHQPDISNAASATMRLKPV